MHSYFQEGLPSWERILNQECVSAVQIFSVCSEPKLKDGTIVNDIRHNNIGKVRRGKNGKKMGREGK